MHYKYFTHFEDAYKELLTSVLDEGSPRDVRGFKTRELSPMLLVTDNPLQNILTNRARKINKTFMMAEFLWIMTGCNNADMVSFYNPNIKTYSDDGEVMAGAYGPKIWSQRHYILDCFKKDINTRQAVLTIWERNPGPSKDIPCTVAMQFLHRDGHLDLIVNMRSNDLWLGLPYDFYTFTMFQNLMAFNLGLKVGRYSHLAGSLHLYDTHYQVAAEASLDRCSTVAMLKSEAFCSDELLTLKEAEEELRLTGKTSKELICEPWKTMKKYFENKCVQVHKT